MPEIGTGLRLCGSLECHCFRDTPARKRASATGDQGPDAVGEVGDLQGMPSAAEPVKKSRGKGVTGADGISYLDLVTISFNVFVFRIFTARIFTARVLTANVFFANRSTADLFSVAACTVDQECASSRSTGYADRFPAKFASAAAAEVFE